MPHCGLQRPPDPGPLITVAPRDCRTIRVVSWLRTRVSASAFFSHTLPFFIFQPYQCLARGLGVHSAPLRQARPYYALGTPFTFGTARWPSSLPYLYGLHFPRLRSILPVPSCRLTLPVGLLCVAEVLSLGRLELSAAASRVVGVMVLSSAARGRTAAFLCADLPGMMMRRAVSCGGINPFL